MNSNASPGSDGFGPAFYKSFWDLVQPNVMSFMTDFHGRKANLHCINKAYIMLIPKKEGACSPSDYCPISLQNTSSKLASKALTSRVQPLIPFLVHADQTGFIKGRSIAENVVYAADIIQTCHKRKAPAIVLKLDFCKASDTVSWSALDAILAVPRFGGFGLPISLHQVSLLCSSTGNLGAGINAGVACVRVILCHPIFSSLLLIPFNNLFSEPPRLGIYPTLSLMTSRAPLCNMLMTLSSFFAATSANVFI